MSYKMGLGSASNLMEKMKMNRVIRKLESELVNSILTSNGNRKASYYFTPSSFICKRSLFYKALGFTQDKFNGGFKLVGMAESGTDRHERLQRHMLKLETFEFVDVEKYIKDNELDLIVESHIGMEWKLKSLEHHLSFMLDGIILHKETGIYYILEIKTEISHKFNKRKYVDILHKHQAIAYTQLLKIPDVIFIYENRDTTDKKYYLYTPTEIEIKDYFTDKLNDTFNYLDRLKLPPKVVESDVSKTEYVDLEAVCKYCRYKSYCERNSMECQKPSE